jgi:hypothetical protein
LEGDEWKIHLNSQVGVFVTIIRDCLRSKELKNVPQELMFRLDSYATKLAPTATSSNALDQNNQESRKLPSPPSNAILNSPSEGTSTAATSPWSISHSIHDMPTVKTIGTLFSISDSQLQKDLNNIRKNCDEKVRSTFLPPEKRKKKKQSE